MASIERSSFGKTPDGKEVALFKLKNGNGLEVHLMAYGAGIVRVLSPDRNGKTADIVLGFDDLQGYVERNVYFAVSCGRVANRIAKGKFTLDGVEYHLAINNGPNSLHGGLKGFDKKVFDAEVCGDEVHFRYVSVDGEEGYPGEVTLDASYSLNADNELVLVYRATSTAATPINIANHSYFNLKGQGTGDVLGHNLQLGAEHYLPVDDTQIPTGEVKAVAATPFDFTSTHSIGERLQQVDGGGQPGYDHNLCLKREMSDKLQFCAQLSEPESGRMLEIHTTQPGVQLYTANFLDGSVVGKGGIAYKQHTGVCLETQNYPDAINQKSFPISILRPGEEYSQRTVYKFSVLS